MRPQVLIVEDNVIVGNHIKAIVEEEDCTAIGIARSSREAYDLVETFEPDLALVDVGLNGDQDGVSLSAQIRETFDTKIVFITSHADKPTLERMAVVKQDAFILKPFSEDELRAILSLVLLTPSRGSESFDLVEYAKKTDTRNAFSEEQTKKLETYIDRNFNKSMTIAEIAEVAGIAAAQFSRRFRATFGTTPYQYVLSKRLDEAKRLLRNTDWSLVDIADNLAFSSQSHFTTAFKKFSGLTPFKYRQLN